MTKMAVLGVFLGLFASQARAACEERNIFPIEKSATIARDINGFELGMSFKEISKISEVKHLAFETYETFHQGVKYTFGLTELGRVFRIESSQNLGKFNPDETFYNSVAAKLIAKYGKSSRGLTPSAPLGWAIVEQVSNTVSGVRNFSTHHASASVTPTADGVMLDVFMLDHRIIWQDEHKLNCEPAKKGAERIQF